MLAERSDISEELDRLKSHLQQFGKLLGWSRRTWQKAGFSVAGNASRSQHHAFENARRRKRSAENHRHRSGSKSGDRKIARTGTEHRMSKETVLAPLVLIVSGPSGSGKSTLVQRCVANAGDHGLAIMYHSGAPRD